MSLETITKEALEAVSYGNLQEKFTELGVPEAWKPGVKKADMIQNALNKLKEIKENLENPVPNSEIETSGEQVSDGLSDPTLNDVQGSEDQNTGPGDITVNDPETIVPENQGDEQDAKNDPSHEVPGPVPAPKISIEKIKENILTVEKLLIAPINESQRFALLGKKEELEKQLEQAK